MLLVSCGPKASLACKHCFAGVYCVYQKSSFISEYIGNNRLNVGSVLAWGQEPTKCQNEFCPRSAQVRYWNQRSYSVIGSRRGQDKLSGVLDYNLPEIMMSGPDISYIVTGSKPPNIIGTLSTVQIEMVISCKFQLDTWMYHQVPHTRTAACYGLLIVISSCDLAFLQLYVNTPECYVYYVVHLSKANTC